jgi:hypothetical protein
MKRRLCAKAMADQESVFALFGVEHSGEVITPNLQRKCTPRY